MNNRAKHLLLVFVGLALAACSDSEPEPAQEPAAPLGVHGTAPAAVGGTPSVITLTARSTSAGGGAPAGSAASGGNEPPMIDQLGLVFTPTTLVARVGERVVFTNSETIVHNVHLWFADNDSSILNVDTDPGARADFVFDRRGRLRRHMRPPPRHARLRLRRPRPSATVFADNSGNFVVPDVPPGAYLLSRLEREPRLATWSRRGPGRADRAPRSSWRFPDERTRRTCC
jgi:plastocyanin